MKVLKSKCIRTPLAIFLVIGGALSFSGCASYKAKPLDDFTDSKTSHLEEEAHQEQSSSLVDS